MATIAGKVQGLSGGKFFVKDEQGNIKELSLGDNIYENSSVYGDSSNSSSAKVEILLSDNDVVVLNQGQQQLIDASLIETAFGTEELFFTREGLDQTIAQHNSIADVDSDLREANFKDAKDKSITEEETTEGEEEVEDEEGESGQFASRDGSLTDVESGLIKKPWPITRTFNEAEKYQNLENLYKKELGANPSNPFEPSNPGNARPTTPTRPSTDKPSNTGRPESEGPRPLEETPEKPTTSVTPPPAVTPPIIPAKLTIFDYETVEHDGVIYLVVKIDKPAEGDIEFTYIFKDGSAKEGEDFIPIENTAIIKSGETEVKIPVKIINDNIYEGTEEFKVVITETKGNVEIEKGEGTVTITDRNDIPTVTIPKDPNPTDEIPKDPITGKDNPPEKPYNPGTGIIPQDPTDLPKDPITNKPLIPGNFDGNETNQDTKDVRVPEGNDAVFKTTLSNPSAKDEIVKITITNQTIEDNDIERPNVKFYDKNGNTLEHTNNPDGSYNVKLPAGETEFYTVVPTVQDATYENEETFGITADINNTTSSATGTITDKNDIPTLTIPKDPNPLDPTNPDKPEEPYNPETGIIPQDPTDLPKDPTTNKPLIPGFFDGNEVNQDTKDVRVPEGNDAVFKTTLSNPSSKDEIVKITITTTPNEEGKASDSDIERDDVKFYDKNGKELSSTKNQDGSYDVKLPAGETTFYTVVPTAQDSIYEVDETFGIKADINNTSSSATGTITDKNDIPTVTHPDDSSKEHPKDPNPLDPENPNKPNNYNPETGITPLDPNDSKVPPFIDKDGNPYTPVVKDPNEPNIANQTTKDVKVPEGNDAVFKTTLSNPSYKDEVVKVTITTTEGDVVGKANEYDISRDDIKFFDENGKELEFTKNEDGSYNVPVEKGQTTFYTVVPTVDNIIYEGDEVFEITAEINNTISKATGTIDDYIDEPKVGTPVDPNYKVPEDSEEDVTPDDPKYVAPLNPKISISNDTKDEGYSLVHNIFLTNKSELTTELTIKLEDGTATIGEDTKNIEIIIGNETIKLTLGTDGKYTSSDEDIVTVTSGAKTNEPVITVKVPPMTDLIKVKVDSVNEEDDIYEGEEKYTIAVKTQFDKDYTTATGTIIDDTELPYIVSIDSSEVVETQGTDPDDITSLVHTVELSGKYSTSENVIIKITQDNSDGANSVDLYADIDLDNIKVKDENGNDLDGSKIEAIKGEDGKLTGEFKVTLPPLTLKFQVHVPTLSDNSFEPNETYKIEATVVGTENLENPTASATGTITDIAPSISILKTEDGAEKKESETQKPAEFKITLDKKSSEPIGIQLSKIHTDTTNADFNAPNQYSTDNGTNWLDIPESGQITIPAGVTEVLVQVPVIDDNIVENKENFKLKIDVVTGSNATIKENEGEASANIIDNDSPQIESIKDPNKDPLTEGSPTPNLNNVKVYEGDDLVFRVKIDKKSSKTETFDFTIANGTNYEGATNGNAQGGTTDTFDYNNIPTFTNGVTFAKNENGSTNYSKIVVPAGVTEFDVIVESFINKDKTDSADAANENGVPNEDFTITIGGKTGVGTIVEGPSQIKSVDENGASEDEEVTPAQAMEGEFLVHTVKLTGEIAEGQKLDITLAGGTATIGEDTGSVRYSIDDGNTWNTVSLTDGKFTLTKTEISTSTEILVAVEAVMDSIKEDDEIYTITASMVSDTGITSSKTATGTIKDYVEATPPSIKDITPNDVTVDEGEEARFKVELDKPSSKDETFEFSIGKTGDSATGGADYENDPTQLIFTNGVTYDPTTEKITVPAGVTTFEVIVPTIVDDIEEENETFTITVGDKTATGTIKDVVPEEGETPIVITDVGGGKPKDPSEEENPNEVEEDRDSETGKLNPAIAEEGKDLIHTIKLSATPTSDTDLYISFANGTATFGTDTGTVNDGENKVQYSLNGTDWTDLPADGKITVKDTNTIFVKVPAIEDNLVEGDEVYYITATMTDNNVTSSKTSTGTILDKNVPDLDFEIPNKDELGNPTYSKTTTGITPEGEEIIYKVKIPTGPHDVPLEYIFTIKPKDDNGIPAEYDKNEGGEKDYDAVPEFTNGVTYDPETGKIKIPAGVTDFEIIIKTNEDDETDDNEEFEFKITKVDDGTTVLTGTGLITEKDIPTKVVSITPDTKEEGATEPLKHTVTIKNSTGDSVDVVIDLGLKDIENPQSANIDDITDKTVTIAMTIEGSEETVTLTYKSDESKWEVEEPEESESLPFAVTVDDGKFVVTVPNGTTTFDVKVPAKEDGVEEGNESYNITASIYNKENVLVSTHTATGTIIDVVGEDGETPELVPNTVAPNISNTIVPEGTEARFKVTIEAIEGKASTFDFSINDGTDTDTTKNATGGDDYENDPTKFSFTNGVTFAKTEEGNIDYTKIVVPAGVTEFEIIVPTFEDETAEPHETFTVTIGQKDGDSWSTDKSATGTGTITDKTPIDTPQVLKITDAATMEGGINTHTITVSKATTVTVNLKDDTATISNTDENPNISDIKAVKYSTDGGKTWTIVDKNNWESFDITLSENDKTIKVEVETLKDSIWEGSETYKITASTKDGKNNITSQKTATGTIVDANPVIDSIKGDTKYEGEELVFDVKLSYETVQETTYEFTIKDGTAKVSPDSNGTNGNDGLNGDYNIGEDIKFTNEVEFAKNEDGTTDYTKIVVPAGVTEFQVIVETNLDNIVDNNEQMTIEVGSKVATGTILDKTKIPGIIGGPGNDPDEIQGDSGDDVIVADFGGLKTTLEPGTNYNMAFILDVSGSMKWNLDNGANGGADSRLELLKAGMMQYIKDTVIPFAKEKDTGSGGEINLAFITFSASSSLKLSMKDLQEENWGAIESAIKNLTASGNTNWESSFITTKNWFKGLETTETDGKAKEGYENITFFITDGDPTAKVSSGSNNTLGYITAAKNEFDAGLGKISDVHAIGVGNMVNKTWLSLFDNTDEVGRVTIDTISPTKENIGILNTNTNWTKDGTNDSPISGSRMKFTDAGEDNESTIYTSETFTGKANSYVTFNYYKDNWKENDSFTWYLEKLNNKDEWEVVDVGANAAQYDTSSPSSNTNTGQKTFQTGILDDGATYRFVFDVKDNTSINNKDYSAMVGNFQYNTSSGSGTFKGTAGKPDVIMTADQLQYALQAGGLYAQLQTVGDDKVHGGDGNDIIFGDAINTDWLEWTDRNHGSASQPDADGSGMAALKYYLGLKEEDQMVGYEYKLVDSDKGVQVIDIYNFIKDNESKFNLDGDERGGNDILDGGAGEDIIYGQGGNDTITTDLHTDGDTIKGDILIDGGTGYDTLILEGNYDIDFSILDSGKSASDRIKNIEEIDLTKGDHQLLNLTLQDVIDMTDSNKELIIKGDGADKVTFAENDNWTKSTDTVDGYYEYTNNDGTKVKVDEAISNQGIGI